MPCLTLLVGNVGSGKSLLASKLSRLHGDVVLNLDAIQESMSGGRYNAYDANKKEIYSAIEKILVGESLKMGFGVVIDRTNMSREIRKKYIDLAKEHKVPVMCFNFGPGTSEELQRRIDNPRDHSPEKWREVHTRLRASYEEPSSDEGIGIILRPPEKYFFWAFDFDSTIATRAQFPECGEPISEIISCIERLYEDLGNVIIIWTCRGKESQGPMLEWLKKHGVPYDFVNENPLVPGDSPKIFAHRYVDDRGVTADVEY